MDLADALNNERIAGAAVDVVSVEPIRPDYTHIAWATLGARKRLMEETVKNIKAFISGRAINVVNSEYLRGGI